MNVQAPPLAARLPIDADVLVVHGPRDIDRNHHLESPQQRHAYDLEVLDGAGRLFRGTGARLDDWVGYGMPVRLPVAGTVVEAIDGWRDLQPGQPAGDAELESPAGNHIVVRHDDGTFTWIAHLQRGSIPAGLRGAKVGAGAVMGRLGNSGNSTEPHLHVHRQSTRGLFDPAARGLPLAFASYTVLGRYRLDAEAGWMDWTPDGASVTSPTIPRRGEVLRASEPSDGAHASTTVPIDPPR